MSYSAHLYVNAEQVKDSEGDEEVHGQECQIFQGGRRRVLPYISNIGMCGPRRKRPVQILLIFVWNREWFLRKLWECIIELRAIAFQEEESGYEGTRGGRGGVMENKKMGCMEEGV